VAALRVVTWNIRAAIGPGPFPDRWWTRIDADRLRAIGSFISGLEADVAALQEVALLSRDGELVDNAGDLGRQLGMAVAYGAVRTFDVFEGGIRRGAGVFGNAILSRAPLGSIRVIDLPAAPRDAFIEPPAADDPAAGLRYADAPPTIREPRCLVIGTHEGLRIGTAHFSHVGSGERRLQAQATVAAFEGAAPALVAGDFNAAIESPELEPFDGWTDAFAEPPGDPGRITTDGGHRIDHVLARGVSVSAARVLRGAGDLSDHLPVLVQAGG
jgi:endonuclease/exonuclease/phosphatase family metal-dependent hydrolase